MVVAACGRIHFDDLKDAPADACTLGPFSTPVELAELDSPTDEFGPWLSDDRLDIYFASDRLDGANPQLFHAHRASAAMQFDPPVEVDLGLGGYANDPFISADGMTLWFVYTATGAFSDDRLYVATRATTAEPFGSTAAMTELNVYAYGEGTPSLTADELTIIFTSDQPSDPGNGDLYIATRAVASAPFDPPRLLADLSTPGAECCSSISADGSSLVYLSDVLSPGVPHIVESLRVGGVYQAPHLLDPALSEPGGENDPQLTYDRTAIVFGAGLTGGTGLQDIYFAERTCLP
jgi:hypothetical protein